MPAAGFGETALGGVAFVPFPRGETPKAAGLTPMANMPLPATCGLALVESLLEGETMSVSPTRAAPAGLMLFGATKGKSGPRSTSLFACAHNKSTQEKRTREVLKQSMSALVAERKRVK